MRLRILLAKVNPEAIAVPTRCSYADCSGQKFHLRQQVKKSLRSACKALSINNRKRGQSWHYAK